MKNRRPRYLGVKVYLVACLLIGLGLSACRTPPAKPPMLVVHEDNMLVIGPGVVFTMEDGSSWTSKTDMLILSRDAVTALQARGYLPGME